MEDIVNIKLPNTNKEVSFKPITMGSIRSTLNLTNDKSLYLKYLDSLIITEGLNRLEKLTTILFMYKICVDDIFGLGDQKFSVDIIIESISNYLINNCNSDIHYNLNGSQFTIHMGIPNDILPMRNMFLDNVIGMSIDSETYMFSDINQEDIDLIIDNIPLKIHQQLDEYINDNKDTYKLELLKIGGGIKHELNIYPAYEESLHFFPSIFMTYNEYTYRETLFLLCESIPPEILLKSYPKDIDDYIALIKKKNSEEKSKNQ